MTYSRAADEKGNSISVFMSLCPSQPDSTHQWRSIKSNKNENYVSFMCVDMCALVSVQVLSKQALSFYRWSGIYTCRVAGLCNPLSCSFMKIWPLTDSFKAVSLSLYKISNHQGSSYEGHAAFIILLYNHSRSDNWYEHWKGQDIDCNTDHCIFNHPDSMLQLEFIYFCCLI